MSKIWMVDAFTDEPYKGNPAGVMIVKDYEEARCQAIAAEMNLSETAFIKPLKNNLFHIRWFTPTVEVKLCGHATLASAHILYEEGIIRNQPILFDSLSGQLQVTHEGEGLKLNLPLEDIGPVLSKSEFEMKLKLKNKIINVVKAQGEIIVEVNSEDDVRQFAPDFNAISSINADGIILTAQGQDFDFVSRAFFPRQGINEDPVTGSAHCKLAHYWRQKLGKQEMFAFQASARGGKIDLKVIEDRVFLKGKAVTMMTGAWKF